MTAAELVRKTAQRVKSAYGKEAVATAKPKIFNVLEYIEQPWGLNMTLFPAQKFLVKLYYNLELDDFLPEDPNLRIQIPDMFNTKILYELTEKEYLSYLHNEGRCNIGEQDHDRRELVLAIGRRAGKCNREGTLVLTDRGIFPIEELGIASEEEFSELEIGVAQEGSAKSRSSHFYNGGVKPTYTLKTKSGYEIGGTANHRVRVMTAEGVVDWRYLDEIRPGDFLAIHRGTDLWASEQLDTKPFHNDRGRKDLVFPDQLDEAWGNLLGYLVGDGSWGHTQGVAVTVEHDETWLYLRDLFDRLFGSCRVQKDKRTKNTGRLEFPSVGMRQFLHDLGWSWGCGRYDKRVPWSILRSPKSVVCAFLRGLFETDGSAEGGGRHITLSTASFELASDVQVLLLNLGIVSNVARKWNPETERYYAILSLKGVRSRRIFAELVGFDSNKKQRPLQAALKNAQEGKSDTESIPHQYSHIRELLEAVPKRNPARGEKGWGRSHLRKAFGNTCKPSSGEDLSYSRLDKALSVAIDLGASEAASHFRELVELDYFYDPVQSIERGEHQVYDLTVPEGESFVANGVVNHNTTLSGIFASYEVYRLLNLYNPQEYYGLPNGNRIQVISVATDKEQAGLLFGEVTTHLAKCDYFKQYIANNTLSHVNFRTPYDIEKFGPNVHHENGKFVSLNGKASLRVTFKSCIAKGLRGSGNIVIILDEVAHFQDKGNSSADEIYAAVTPSSAAFSRKDSDTGRPAVDKETGDIAPVESRIILISSPLGRSGLFFKKFSTAMHGGPAAANILAIQAPTWEINPTIPSSYYKEKYHDDPVVFATEHGARFSDQAKGWLERKKDLEACIDVGRRPTIRPTPRKPYQMGIDVGLVEDGTAVSITHAESDYISLDYHEVWYAGVDWKETNPHLHGEYTTGYAKTLETVERLDFGEIANWIEALAKRFHITAGLFDQWNGIPLEQALHKKGLKQFRSEFFTRDQNSKIYQAAKSFILNGSLRLYDYPIPERAKEGQDRHSSLITELLSLEARKLSKNIVLVQAPQVRGNHDDLSDSLVRATWLSMNILVNQKHVAGGGLHLPRASASMTSERYQRIRDRQRGYIGDRRVPRRRPFLR
jgi:intein/homing endonuclease